jgi:hypothetical protein
MPLSVRLLLVLGLCVFPPLVGGADDASKPEPSYYPITVGNVWNYKTDDGKFTAKVISQEKIEGQNCARIELSFGGKPNCFEHIAVKPDGIYRYSFNGVRSAQPVLLLKLPPRKGDSWTVEAKGAGDPIKGTFKVDEDEVKVPAGTYKTFSVTLKQDTTVTGAPAVGCTYWFAPDVGIVKQEYKVGNQLTTAVLEKFEPKAAGK